jgi:hypothetical protein
MSNSQNVLVVESPSGERGITRREFTVESLMALFAGVAVTISTSACGSSGDGGGNPVTPDGSRGGNVSANHGHVATVTAAQITAANNVTLDIRGSADHPHTVGLTGAEVVQIGNGVSVTKVSSTDPSASSGTHDHTVTFN